MSDIRHAQYWVINVHGVARGRGEIYSPDTYRVALDLPALQHPPDRAELNVGHNVVASDEQIVELRRRGFVVREQAGPYPSAPAAEDALEDAWEWPGKLAAAEEAAEPAQAEDRQTDHLRALDQSPPARAAHAAMAQLDAERRALIHRIADLKGRPPDSLGESSSVSELGDFIATMFVVKTIEREYAVDLPTHELRRIHTIGELVDLVCGEPKTQQADPSTHCWRTADGRLLVEWGASEQGKKYALFDAAGAVTGTFEPHGCSDQEHLYHMTYDVEGPNLVERTHHEVDSGRESRYVSGAPLKGLVPVVDAVLPVSDVEDVVTRFKNERNRRAWAEQEAREAQRPRTLAHVLEPRGVEAFDVELFQEGEDVIARVASEELWREPFIGWSDTRESEVRRLLEARYPTRFGKVIAHFWWDAR